MKKYLKWKWILPALVAVFLMLQFTNPTCTNPAIKNDFITAVNPPPQFAAQVRAACYDCHSHETKWPWYSRVAPASWLVVKDVDDGRERLNLSDWPVEPARAAKKLERMSEELDYKEMPPGKYTMIHADARLTDAQRKELQDWADATAEKLKSSVVTN